MLQGWSSFGLLGHSMGAGIAGLYAATFPEQVKVGFELYEVVRMSKNCMVLQELMSIL